MNLGLINKINELSFADTKRSKRKDVEKTLSHGARTSSSGCFFRPNKSRLFVFTSNHLLPLVPCSVDALRGIIDIEIECLLPR